LNPIEDRFPRLWAGADRISLIVLGGLLFWLFSILVVTLPAALAALFAAVAPLFAPASGELFGRFWRAFRRSLVPALLLGLLDLVVGGVIYLDIQILWGVGALWAQAAAFGLGSLGALALMVNLFAWPLLAWFPQPLPKLLKRSFFLAAAHPFWALGGIVSGAVSVLLLLLLPGWLLALVPLVGPGLFATTAGFCAWQVMKRYARPEDEIAE
jgi:uncharacterized membrane protein YesL